MDVGGKPIFEFLFLQRILVWKELFNGDTTNMVPVLLGMDHLSGKDSPESALTIDFNTGMAIESIELVSYNTSITM